MGFLSGLTGMLGGGASGKTSAGYSSGFGMLPSEIQAPFKTFGTQLNTLIPGAAQAFTPLQQTADETSAFDTIRGGFTPTAESLQSDISMLSNPWDEFVLGDVNRAANSDYSVLKQDMNSAGQFGSNRQRLGANDIEQTRLGTIGKLRQGQYDSALQQVFNNLIPQRQADAAGKLGIGEFQRNLAGETAQAPYTGMLSLAQALSGLPKDTSQAQTSTSSTKSGNPLQAVGTAASIFSMLSDRRAKENIVSVGVENGWPMYEYNYIGDKQRYVGVMAQDVQILRPDAVSTVNGYMVVDYGKIGVNFYAIDTKSRDSACSTFVQSLLMRIRLPFERGCHLLHRMLGNLLPHLSGQLSYTHRGMLPLPSGSKMKGN